MKEAQLFEKYLKSGLEDIMSFPEYKQKVQPIKAYKVYDKNRECNEAIVWAESSGKAKINALQSRLLEFLDCEFIEMRAYRKPEFDKYADTEKVPIQELLKQGWYFGCNKCHSEELDENDIETGEAFIDEQDACSFVKGGVICKGCKEE